MNIQLEIFHINSWKCASLCLCVCQFKDWLVYFCIYMHLLSVLCSVTSRRCADWVLRVFCCPFAVLTCIHRAFKWPAVLTCFHRAFKWCAILASIDRAFKWPAVLTCIYQAFLLTCSRFDMHSWSFSLNCFSFDMHPQSFLLTCCNFDMNPQSIFVDL